MQFSTLAVVFFATLATARSHGHHGHRFHHRRAFNESTPVDLTTLTVQITSTHTVFSCAQNVTSCPARDATATRTVTEVVDLTTTVCPVASASAISSKVIASAAQNPTALAPTAKTTDAAAVETGDSVLTYTLGTGSSQTVVTTTIKHTKTATAYTTKYVTYDGSAQETPVENGNNKNGNGNGKGSEPTTTIRTTSTSTRTVTVKPASSAGPGTGSFIGSPNGEDSSEGSNAGGCAAPVTVTVARSTVTVTYTPPAAEATVPSGPAKDVVGDNNVIETTPTDSNAEAPSVTSEPANGGVDEPEIVVTATVPVMPVPYRNTTETATRRHSSGFLKAPKPTGTGSRIQPAPTGWY